MTAHDVLETRRGLLERMGSVPGVSVRSMLIAGVTAVGIATATSHGVPLPATPSIAAPTALIHPRYSSQDVQLTAGAVPIVSDIAILALNGINAVDTILSTGVDFAATLTSAIPLVSALAPQIRYIYFCVLRSFVYYPLAGAALFAATLNPTHLVNIAVHIVNRLVNFVQYELDYFINLPSYLFNFGFLPVGLGFGAAGAGALGKMSATADGEFVPSPEGEGTPGGGDLPPVSDEVDNADATVDPVAEEVGETEETVPVEEVVETLAEPVVEAEAAEVGLEEEPLEQEEGLLETAADEAALEETVDEDLGRAELQGTDEDDTDGSSVEESGAGGPASTEKSSANEKVETDSDGGNDDESGGDKGSSGPSGGGGSDNGGE